MKGASLFALLCVGIVFSEAVRTFRLSENSGHLHSVEANELLHLKRNVDGEFHIGPFQVIRPLKTASSSSFLEVQEQGGNGKLKSIARMLMMCVRSEKASTKDEVLQGVPEHSEPHDNGSKKVRLSDLDMPDGWTFGDDDTDMNEVCTKLGRDCIDSSGEILPSCVQSGPVRDEVPEYDFETVDDIDVAELKKRLIKDLPDSEFSTLQPERLLGEGFRGQVWLVEKGGKKYALKIMFNHKESRVKAQMECGIAHHAATSEAGEYVADCYEHRVVGEDIDSTAFLLMEYAGGTSLRKILESKQGPVPIEKARKYIRQLLSVVKAVGEDGVEFSIDGSGGQHRWIHRDLNPQNVVITADDNVKVIDWGEAYECKGTPPSGSVGQTLLYADPAPFVTDTSGKGMFEACFYSLHCQPCHSYDEFAIGAIYYEMVTLETFLNMDVVNTRIKWLINLLNPRNWELYRKLFTIYPRIVERSVAKDVVSMKDIADIQQMTYLDPSLRTQPSMLLVRMSEE